MHGSLKAPYQLVESRRVATVGATRKLELCPSIVRIGSRDRCIADLDDRSLLARRVRARPGDYFARLMKARATGAAPRDDISLHILDSPEPLRASAWSSRPRADL
jgi:hypothetical protein